MSILSGVCLPVLAILSVALVSLIRRNYLKNELAFAAILFAAGAAAAGLLSGLRSVSTVLTLLLLGILVGCMHGINLLLIGFVPGHYAKTGVVSLIAGTLNTFTYLGAALSTYGFAVVSEGSGWMLTIVVWGVVAIAGGLLCLSQIRRWRAFTAEP